MVTNIAEPCELPHHRHASTKRASRAAPRSNCRSGNVPELCQPPPHKTPPRHPHTSSISPPFALIVEDETAWSELLRLQTASNRLSRFCRL